MTKDEFYSRAADFLNEYDHFAKKNNIRITKIREGYAEAVFDADDRHLNGLGIVQGGALYTLADLAFAGAVNSFGEKAVGMNSSVSYLKPGTDRKFHAVATTLHRGKRTGVFSVDVFDSKERLLVRATMTGAFLGHPFFEDEEIEPAAK